MKLRWINILLVLLFLLLIYLISTRLFGHSATDLTINITLFTFLGGLIYYLNTNIMNHVVKLNREFGEFKVKTINTFERLKDDTKEIKNRLKKR